MIFDIIVIQKVDLRDLQSLPDVLTRLLDCITVGVDVLAIWEFACPRFIRILPNLFIRRLQRRLPSAFPHLPPPLEPSLRYLLSISLAFRLVMHRLKRRLPVPPHPSRRVEFLPILLLPVLPVPRQINLPPLVRSRLLALCRL
jgi:hypothetical protein